MIFIVNSVTVLPGGMLIDYLELEVQEDGTFDVPKENCKVEGEVVFFKIPLKVQRSDWVWYIGERVCICTMRENDTCLVYAISVSDKEESCLALNDAFDEGNYAEKGCKMTYGLSPR